MSAQGVVIHKIYNPAETCSTNVVTKLPTWAVCIQPFFIYYNMPFVSLFLIPLSVFYLFLCLFTFFFILLSVLYLLIVFLSYLLFTRIKSLFRLKFVSSFFIPFSVFVLTSLTSKMYSIKF